MTGTCSFHPTTHSLNFNKLTFKYNILEIRVKGAHNGVIQMAKVKESLNCLINKTFEVFNHGSWISKCYLPKLFH